MFRKRRARALVQFCTTTLCTREAEYVIGEHKLCRICARKKFPEYVAPYETRGDAA